MTGIHNLRRDGVITDDEAASSGRAHAIQEAR